MSSRKIIGWSVNTRFNYSGSSYRIFILQDDVWFSSSMAGHHEYTGILYDDDC